MIASLLVWCQRARPKCSADSNRHTNCHWHY